MQIPLTGCSLLSFFSLVNIFSLIVTWWKYVRQDTSYTNTVLVKTETIITAMEEYQNNTITT